MLLTFLGISDEMRTQSLGDGICHLPTEFGARNNLPLNRVKSTIISANNKSAFPLGYTNDHYIAANQVLEYLIRFQNIGDTTAVNIRIEDQLDLVHLDINSFQFTGSSHDYTAVVDSMGFVQIFFDNIMLSDSISDNVNSIGWIQYTIIPSSNCEPGDIISNSATIFFDDNEPVFTNEVSHTIYNCSMMQSVPEEVITCIANPVVMSIDTSFTYNYFWYDNDQQVSVGPDFNYAFPEVGSHILILERSNPICSRIDTINIQSTPFPSNELIVTGDAISAVEGVQWEWYFNDDLLSDTGQSIIANESGVYYAFIYSAEGCMTISQVHSVLYVVNRLNDSLLVYPNPTEGILWVDGCSSCDQIEILDLNGKIIKRISGIIEHENIVLDEVKSGIYFLRIVSKHKENSQFKIFVK